MPRLTKLNDILFPVQEHPVFVVVPTKSGVRSLPVPDKKAIVNTDTDRVLGVVSRSYRLVTNRQALEWAHQCCQTVFPETKSGEWEVKTSDAPATGGHCFIDLRHNSTALDFEFVPAKDRPDAFGPFIRVTNSYNGLRALAFDIGFFRKVCQNGMIVPESIIRFKYTHSYRDIGDKVSFEIAQKRLSEIKASFNEYFRALLECEVDRSDFERMFCGVLLIKKPKNMKSESSVTNDWKILSKHIKTLCDQYAKEIGENAYAVFNAITEFASHPPKNRCIFRDRNSFQRIAGVWLSKFSQECLEKDFKLSYYLENLPKHNGNEINLLNKEPNRRF